MFLRMPSQKFCKKKLKGGVKRGQGGSQRTVKKESCMTKLWVYYKIDILACIILEDAGTFGIYKLFWNYLNSCEFDDLPKGV